MITNWKEYFDGSMNLLSLSALEETYEEQYGEKAY